MENWEYKVVSFDTGYWTKTGLPDDLNIQIDRFGAQGWELVNVVPLCKPSVFSYGRTSSIVVFFKRKITDVR